MTLQTLISIYQYNIDKLKEELLAYTNEENLWKKADGISNSAGTLALHLIGNLNHFIGATLGNTGYVRDREAEFSLRNVPLKQILEELEQTKEMLTQTLTNLPLDKLTKVFPRDWKGEEVNTDFMLIHFLNHFSYHLGQVNYHRRILA